MYYVYILQSSTRKRFYIGFSEDVAKRLKQHNAGRVRSTSPYVPWAIVYTEECSTRDMARYREKQIKSYKGGEAFYRLLEYRSRLGRDKL
ncbi:GIY-YIG nuclease family protein [Candidatus Uhrbacteria bacterium]|nr:GIY-YIG nuclease family protein [Candidatus Uhrbacteria bacterium]MBD3283922.1 GIY-YIG nuclease family protein [Candidatus Uhrbacteria bacterium]